MWRRPCALLLPLLMMTWYGAVDSKPLFGLLSLFGGANRTSVAQTLLLSHLQQKVNALDALANLITLAGNATISTVAFIFFFVVPSVLKTVTT